MSLPALKDLFFRHRAQDTGLWRLGQEPGRTLFLEAGQVVFATSTHPLDRLTHLLVERGKITQAQLDYAMANLNPSISIGKNLIEMGFITQRDLLDVARAQVERVVWACLADLEEQPDFEARELDATTVRLPFDTPAMLLAGVLNLTNRERMLEELGPLNQVVVLEGRRHQELTLPPDLVKLPNLLDGTRTLLELNRESGTEPFRLGAFVLFLREMGWAKLHELPPLDRKGLELALDPPEPTLSLALPLPPPVPQASLFAEIHASQLPTTNLDHLSEALDRLESKAGREGPFPSETRPPVRLGTKESVQYETAGRTEPPGLGSLYRGRPPQPSQRPWALVGILVFLGASWFGLSWLHPDLFRIPGLPQKTEAPSQEAPTSETLESTQSPVTTPNPGPAPTNPTSATPKPNQSTLFPTFKTPPSEAPAIPPAPEAPPPVVRPPQAPSSKADRLKAIRQGDWNLTLQQGAAQRKALQGKWTLRLEIACQGSTVQHALDLLKGTDPDLFVLPISMRDGRTCYQVFLGAYPSEALAREAALNLPAPFLAEGNRPRPFPAAQIPDQQ